MQNRTLAAGILAWTLCASAAALAAGPSPFVGEWHWNKAESNGPAGETPPQGMVLTVTSADAAHVAWTLVVTDDKGTPHRQTFNGTGNGKAIPISGATDGSTIAFTVTATSFDSVSTAPNGDTDRASCSLSPDGKKMTCRGTESDGKGHTANYTDVYDRK